MDTYQIQLHCHFEMIEKGFYIKTLKKSFEQKRKWFVFVINWTVNPLFFFTVVFSYNILDFCSWHPLKILYWKTARCKCFYCLTLEWAFKKQNSLKFFYKCLEWRVKKKKQNIIFVSNHQRYWKRISTCSRNRFLNAESQS